MALHRPSSSTGHGPPSAELLHRPKPSVGQAPRPPKLLHNFDGGTPPSRSGTARRGEHKSGGQGAGSVWGRHGCLLFLFRRGDVGEENPNLGVGQDSNAMGELQRCSSLYPLLLADTVVGGWIWRRAAKSWQSGELRWQQPMDGLWRACGFCFFIRLSEARRQPPRKSSHLPWPLVRGGWPARLG